MSEPKIAIEILRNRTIAAATGLPNWSPDADPLSVLLDVADAAEAVLRGADEVTGAAPGTEPWERLIGPAIDLRKHLARLGDLT